MNYMHRHSRARCKQKKKKLALKAFFKRTLENRDRKRLKALEPKGRTITGRAIKQAVLIRSSNYKIKVSTKNQRQIRKRRRQCPHSKKWAAA